MGNPTIIGMEIADDNLERISWKAVRFSGSF